MDNFWFELIFGIASLYFGAQTARIFPTFLRMLAALLSGKVKWPGPRIHAPNPHASNVRARLGIGYDNLFSDFSRNSLGVIGAFVFSILTFLASTPQMRGYVRIKSPWEYLCLSMVALVGGGMALTKAIQNRTQVNRLLSDLAEEVEPRGIEGQSIEAEYVIEHPLTRRQSEWLSSTRALNMFYESVTNQQDGNAQKALTLYQDALAIDPALHTHARDALAHMAESPSLEDAGAIYYWLGVHSEYLKENRQAAVWYTKAVDAFHKIRYQKREARAHCNLGTVKMKLKDPSGMAEYEKAIKLNPMDGTAHINMGMAYYMTDKHERALDAFAEAISVDPGRYAPVVVSQLQRLGYTWKEDMEAIRKKVVKKHGMDLDTLTASEREDIFQANRYFEIGNGLFQSGRYKEALEQFDQGKLVTNKFPGNFFGVSMTAMQMIEVGAISKDQIPYYLEKAEQNVDECLRIVPTHLDYLNAKKIIGDYKKKYHV